MTKMGGAVGFRLGAGHWQKCSKSHARNCKVELFQDI